MSSNLAAASAFVKGWLDGVYVRVAVGSITFALSAFSSIGCQIDACFFRGSRVPEAKMMAIAF